MQAIYRNVVFDRVGRPARPDEIVSLETALGARLPAEFAAFIAEIGGGSCDFSIDISLPDGHAQTIAVSDWHGVENRTTFDQALDFARKTFGIPAGVLPIANSNWEHFVFLDLSPDGGGKVVIFIMGMPAWTGWNTESTFITVAPSFTELLDRLRLDDDTVEMLLEELGDNEEDDRRIQTILDTGRPGWRTQTIE